MSTDNTVGITVGEVKGLRADFEEKLSSDSGREWLEAFKIFLKKQNPWVVVKEGSEVVIEKTVRLLKEVGKVILSATAEKETKKSFIGDRYYYRAPELDSWLPKLQPDGKEGEFTVHQLEKQLNFREIAAAILGLDETSDLDLLAKALIENGHTVVPSQIESLIERTDAGENTGLRTDGWGNFFFVHNKEGGVSVVFVYRYDDRQWYVVVRRFDYDHRWGAEARFFSRNN